MSFISVLNRVKVVSEPLFAKGRGVPGKTIGFDADGFAIPVDPAAASGLPLGKVLFADATTGVDATAVKGSLGQPFKTLTAAKNAAVSGDLIHVFPGLYDQDSYIGKNGVDWFFELGARVIPANQNVAIFSDSAGVLVCKIRGYGYFKVLGNYNDDQTTVELSKSGSFVDMEALEVGSVEVWGSNSRARFTNCRFTNGGTIAAYNSATKLELINCDIINTIVTMPQGVGCMTLFTNCRFEINADYVAPPFAYANATPTGSASPTLPTNVFIVSFPNGQVGEGSFTSGVNSGRFFFNRCKFMSTHRNLHYAALSAGNKIYIKDCEFYTASTTEPNLKHDQTTASWYLINNVGNKAIAGEQPFTNQATGAGWAVEPDFSALFGI